MRERLRMNLRQIIRMTEKSSMRNYMEEIKRKRKRTEPRERNTVVTKKTRTLTGREKDTD